MIRGAKLSEKRRPCASMPWTTNAERCSGACAINRPEISSAEPANRHCGRSGANSLTLVKNLQIGRVKIDGSFVRDILTDRNSKATVRAIVELAKGLSIDTVAEFVESEEIAQAVRKLGVDYAQGYHYGKPEPLDQLLKNLDNDESLRLRKLFLEI